MLDEMIYNQSFSYDSKIFITPSKSKLFFRNL